LGIPNPEDYLAKASNDVRVARGLRDDLLAVLFPHGAALPSELLQTRVKIKLLALVEGIERRLLGSAEPSAQSWDILARSGLLREPALIHFALARIAEEKTARNMQQVSISALSQLPVQLLSHENSRLSGMARDLLHAEQLANGGNEQLHQRLDSIWLHPLCWRIVAALQGSIAVDKAELVVSAEQFLAVHDGKSDPSAVARKLVFFLSQEHAKELADPRKVGLHLFVAGMSQDFGLDSDSVLRLLAEGSDMPLLLLLKGRGVQVDEMPGILAALRGSKIQPELVEIYAALDAVETRATIAGWKEIGDGAA
jgi:hypothetical protein